ncbi:MAG: DUF1269 domain-containing protein [Chloroflexales bacterium]|nr:DUF1269 domain-containing protein [Chloroflexales bacterium]
MTSQLVILAFDGAHAATTMLDAVRSMEQRGLLEIDDAVVAMRPAASEMLFNAGSVSAQPVAVSVSNPEVEITQTDSRRGQSAMIGGGIGLLAGWLFGGPIGGLAIGTVLGAMRDRGISDRFVNELSAQLQPDSSAIFLLVRRADTYRVLEELRPHQGRVVHTTLTPETEQALRKALENEA